MAHNVVSVLLGLSCPCIVSYETILNQHNKKLYSLYKTGCGVDCCKNKEKSSVLPEPSLTDWESCVPYDPSQDPIFPPELQIERRYDEEDLEIFGPRVDFYRPVTLEKLLDLKRKFPDAELISGATLVGLMERYSVRQSATWISLMGVKELKYRKMDEKYVEFGAALTLSELQDIVKETCSKLSDTKTTVLRAVLHNLDMLYSVQLRNVATWAGNIATGSPISDLTVPFLGANCQLQITDGNGTQKWIHTDENFFTGVGKKVALKNDEFITAGRIPLTQENEFFSTYKQGLRRGPDSALVNAALWVQFKPETNVLSHVRLAYGGMASKPILAKVSNQLIGKNLNEHLLDEATKELAKEFYLPPGSYGRRERYRTSLCLAFFFKFYLAVRHCLENKFPHLYPCHLSPQEVSYISNCPAESEPVMKATQIFEAVPAGQLSEDPVGRPVCHQYIERHTSGEAAYIGDIHCANVCYLGFVLSSQAHARLVKVDASEALKVAGVLDYVDFNDIPPTGSNNCGTIMDADDTVFATDEVTAVGQTIGVVVAENSNVAKQAARLVRVEYEDLPAVTKIQEGIAAEMYYGQPVIAERGDVEKAMQESEHSVSGEVSIGGQEHLYMETMSSLVIPGEGGEWEIHCSTQDVPVAQEGAANVLGLKKNECVVKVKRVGGAFGGKLSQFSRALWPALVAAEKLRRPVKSVLTRRDDIVMTGKRHPGYCVYSVGFSSEGKITALKCEIYLDAGHTTDQSLYVLNITVPRMDNCYWIPNAKIVGRAVRTNLPSNTGFRGFGTPQGYFFMECILETVSTFLNIPTEMVRERNLLKKGQRGLLDDLVRDDYLEKCWEECTKFSNFYERKNDVQQFNNQNKWRKRGVVLLATRFGIGMVATDSEQGAALVNIYTDGTVMVAHGGLELGQGLNTKILQIASRALRLPMEKITILDNSSDKVPNAVVTGGSQGSDVHGLAVKNACETLLQRLEPIVNANPQGTWEEWVQTAFEKQISLSATGFGVPRYDTYDPKEKIVGNPRYYVPCAACTEVEIDCLTGDHEVLRTDIVMDVGNSINPAVDIGQIEGAFLQGYGLFVTEELVYSEAGQLLTDSAGKYKIPTVSSLPREFRIAFLKGSGEKFNIYSSKGVGEPPFFLGCSAFFAIKEAINAYRTEKGLKPASFVESPATPERIRLACDDT